MDTPVIEIPEMKNATALVDIAVLPDMTASYNMILSSSMFRHTIYEIDDINHKFNVSVEENDYVRRLIAYYDEKQGRLYVHYNE